MRIRLDLRSYPNRTIAACRLAGSLVLEREDSRREGTSSLCDFVFGVHLAGCCLIVGETDARHTGVGFVPVKDTGRQDCHSAGVFNKSVET